ncbi:DUF6119 family protein [Agrobacterium rosae]|uniref:DUF6119 family protein n=1 Tax=Agrobacterium rosae TaxID=1972867 RepID=UPI00122EFE26|nr:DUF6119 family protein [Agrobacterium rosae]KAA3506452.1 sporadically distributed protein, TIGR04141 family [Agrobacterium rosae]KAA3511399.1 sporadically distributed protein, TIGR04141 family [Agrobacterium rosae]MQB51370.1 sporadically distributed protein, TIGR04141 family [Agrobacterium rosae]
MVIAPRRKAVTLNLRLLKVGIGVEDAFRDTADTSEVDTASPPDSRLFIASSRDRPTWRPLLSDLTQKEPNLWTESSSAVLMVPIEDQTGSSRTFALCFGGGHFLIDPAKIERNFGLKVVLNTVSRRDLRSLDSATLDATVFQRRTQASRNSDLAGFGIDVQRDLLRVAAGSPTDKSLASSVAGRDSLTITCTIQPEQLKAKLSECLNAFEDDEYRLDYEWVDNVQIVTDASQGERLDELLGEEIALLRAGDQSDLHMCPPEVVDYIQGQDIAYFGRGFSREKAWHPQLDITDYVAELNAVDFDQPFEVIKTDHYVHMHADEVTRSKRRWRVYDCFVYECDLDQQKYVLFAGTWYRISEVYKNRVEAFFQSLIKPSIVAQSAATNEQELITELNQRPDLLMMDRTKVNPRGVNNGNIEVCDFLSHQRQLIHLKDGHSSSSISHLWMQAVTSCDSLMSDAHFRNGVRRQARRRESEMPVKTGFEQLLPLGGTGRVNTTAYTVVYGILRKRKQRANTLDIPFFSKVSLQAPASLLAKYGYGVEVHLIEKLNPVVVGEADG